MVNEVSVWTPPGVAAVSNALEVVKVTALQATLDVDLNPLFTRFELDLSYIYPEINATSLLMRVHNGVAWQTTNVYKYDAIAAANALVSIEPVINKVSAPDSGGLRGIVNVRNYDSDFDVNASLDAYLSFQSGGTVITKQLNGSYLVKEPITKVRFYFSSGNVAQGLVKVFGKE